jgi:hypothetical protein
MSQGLRVIALMELPAVAAVRVLWGRSRMAAYCLEDYLPHPMPRFSGPQLARGPRLATEAKQLTGNHSILVLSPMSARREAAALETTASYIRRWSIGGPKKTVASHYDRRDLFEGVRKVRSQIKGETRLASSVLPLCEIKTERSLVTLLPNIFRT